MEVVVNDQLLRGRGLQALRKMTRPREVPSVQHDHEVVIGDRPPVIHEELGQLGHLAVARLGRVRVEDEGALPASVEDAGEGGLGAKTVPVRALVPREEDPLR